MKDSDSLLRIPLRAVNVTVCHAVVLMLLASMLGFKVPLIMYVLIFFASLACSVVADCLRPAERRITAFVVTVVMLAVGTLLHEKTINGAFWFARRFVELINQYYGEVLQWKAGEWNLIGRKKPNPLAGSLPFRRMLITSNF